jgi:hypothetical protein
MPQMDRECHNQRDVFSWLRYRALIRFQARDRVDEYKSTHQTFTLPDSIPPSPTSSFVTVSTDVTVSTEIDVFL